MVGRKRVLTLLGGVAIATLVASALACAQSAVEPDHTDRLALEEQRLAEKYKHLEDVLLRMAELTAATDPRRAALLKKAVAQSKDQLIAVRLDRLVEMLGKDQLSKALENQSDVAQDLRAILELLMSENRGKHIENEKARIREYLKQIGGLIKQEKDIQGRTTGGDDLKRLAGEQGKVADKTAKLSGEVRKNEEQKGDGQKGKGESKPSEKDGKKEGEANGQSSEAAKSPISKSLDAARQRMKEAESKLSEAKKQGASEKQEEAILALQTAKAKLEEILRQLREEEIGRMLLMLELRFRKMLQMQEEVYEGTVRLDKTPQAERTHNHEIEASRLSGRESQIVVEIDKALVLLHDDGSAVAFLEASRQMREDMQQVVERLTQAKVDKVTQGIEEDIIAALKEMIESLKKAQKSHEKNKSRGQPMAGQQRDPPLVDSLAELKMIRALQMRVNTRTARYAKLIDGEQAKEAELVQSIQQLAERQQRIHRITRDLLTGKNQ